MIFYIKKKLNAILLSFLFLCIMQPASKGLATDTFFNDLVFERMWPQLTRGQSFNRPCDVAVDNDGFIYVADTGNFRIQKYTANGLFVCSWGVRGTGKGEFVNPSDIAFHPDGYIYVSDWGADATNEEAHRIQKFTLSGEWVSYVGDWGTVGDWGDDTPEPEYRVPRGIAVDKEGYVYIAESCNNCMIKRIWKFTSDDEFVKTLKIFVPETWTEEEIKKVKVEDVAVGPDGNIFALVHFNLAGSPDKMCYPLQSFTPEGMLIDKWPIDWKDDSMLSDICVDNNHNIYISERGHVLKIYSKKGELIKTIKNYGTGDGELHGVEGITLDEEGDLYIADSDNHRIQKMSPDWNFISSIGSSGDTQGRFVNPWQIAVGPDNRIYVVDSSNARIQVFEPDGKFYLEIPTENYVTGITVDSEGYVYTTHPWQDHVMKYDSAGSYVALWKIEDITGNPADEDNPIDNINITFGNAGYLYLTIDGHHQTGIYKLTTNGEVVTKWGSYGKADGEFIGITGLDIGLDGSIFVIEFGGLEVDDIPGEDWLEVARVQKFDPNGKHIASWGHYGSENGNFIEPLDVAVDSSGFVYVADAGNYRIQKFTSNGEFVESAGSHGTEPGMFARLNGLTFDSQGNLYTTEEGTNRVQVFSSSTKVPDDTGVSDEVDRAIIVAAGGPYPGNTLWDATQICANFAYRTLLYQGYSKERIQYLSWDNDLDFDGNALLDDVDGIPTGEALQNALTSWALGSKNLLVYMINHGGIEQFRMGEFELLSAADFNTWFTQAHTQIPGKTILVYDACRSGSFLSSLSSTTTNPPILITSTARDENAYFTANGSLSFSYLFWAAIQNGMNIMDAFVSTKNAIEYTYTSQSPMLDDNGNGIGNEDSDGYSTAGVYLGNGTVSAGDIPAIQEVSPAQIINGTSSASIYAANISDADGISRVWAVITPPDFLPGGPESPVLYLPSIDLILTETNHYEATYDGFTANGIYQIAVYAEDRLGSISLPRPTTIKQTAGDASASISSDLFQLRLPCINLEGTCMEMIFERDTKNSSGLFYSPDLATMTDVSCTSICPELASNYDIFVSRLSYGGLVFSFNLLMRGDLPGLAWELDVSSIHQTE